MNERKFHQQLDKLNENLSRIAAALERMSSNTNSTEDYGYDDYTEENYRIAGEEVLGSGKIEITPRFYYLYFKSITDAKEAVNRMHFHIGDPDKYISLYEICRVVYGKTAPKWTNVVTWRAGDLFYHALDTDIIEDPRIAAMMTIQFDNTVALRFDRQECVEDIPKNPKNDEKNMV